MKTLANKLRLPRRLARRLPFGRFMQDDSGSPAVEFAFIAPVLILLLFGILQFGFAFYTYNEMVNGAREAARRMAVGVTEQEAEDWARRSMALPRNYAFDAATAADSVTMTITLPLSQAMMVSVLPLPDVITQRPLTASVTMRKE